MSINEFIVITPDSCAMVADQLHPETGGSVSDSVDRIARYFDGMAVGGFYFNTISVELGMTQASADITFSLVAAGDTVTIGTTTFTGSNSPSGTSQFQTNATPSGAADIVAAASLASVINQNATTKTLVTASNTAGTAVVHLVVQQPGVIGNFVPVSISAHGVISGSSSGSNSRLLTAGTYAALAKSTITNTGNTILNGDLGLSPGTSVTGFPPGLVSGTKHIADSAAAQAQTDATAAAVALQATGPGTDITGANIGGTTKTPGTYSSTSTIVWSSGDLTLNGAGEYIFLGTTSMTTAAGVTLHLINGATADKVYFVTGTFITFGANNTLAGNYMAGSAITTASNTVLSGRLITYGAGGTAITFPSAAVASSPFATSGMSGGADGGCLPKVTLA
jgi:Ice-binding-like